MRKLIILVILSAFILGACAPVTPVPPTPALTEAAQPTETAVPEVTEPVGQSYENSEFGLSFTFPADWFGPDEYVAEDTLRVEIGSDTVYPYGTGPEERVYTQTDTYSIVLQYTKNNTNDYWTETWQTLQSMADGESVSDSRGKLIRVGLVNLDGFEGMEFISTLSDTAQTEAVYIRQVILVNAQSDLLSIMGSPSNVVVNEGENWREVYERIDGEYAGVFHAVLESLTIQ